MQYMIKFIVVLNFIAVGVILDRINNGDNAIIYFTMLPVTYIIGTVCLALLTTIHGDK